MPVATELSGILVGRGAGPRHRRGLPCASCLFDVAAASGMAGGEPCPLKATLLRRYALASGRAGGVTGCPGFAPGYAEAGEEPASDVAHGITRSLS